MRRRHIVMMIALVVVAGAFIIYRHLLLRRRRNKVSQAKSIHDERSKDTKSIVTFTDLGRNGNFGNQLFQIAAVIGAAEKYNSIPSLPAWKYSKYFIDPLPSIPDIRSPEVSVEEYGPNYQSVEISNDERVYDIKGYRQSDKYFKNCADRIRHMFKFRQEYIDIVTSAIPELSQKCIGIHVRRGDYMTLANGNKMMPCSPEYYINSLEYILGVLQIPKESPVPVIICSDDIEWCKDVLAKLLGGFGSAIKLIFSPFRGEDSDILDFIALYLCANEIQSNSTYSWWSSWLKSDPIMVVSPTPWFSKEVQPYYTDDIYHAGWILADKDTGKIVRGSLYDGVVKFFHNLFEARSSSSDDSSNFGRVYVIGLESLRDTRVKHAMELLSSLNLEPSHFKAVDKTVIDVGEYTELGIISRFNDSTISGAGTSKLAGIGCTISHLTIWGEMIYKDYPRVTIFEDDISTYASAQQLEATVARLFDAVGDDWDIIYLGRCLDKCSLMKRVDHGIYRVFSPFCLHSYIISNRGAKKMISYLPFMEAVDTEVNYKIMEGVLTAYAIHPSIFQQDIFEYNSTLRNIQSNMTIAHDCKLE